MFLLERDLIIKEICDRNLLGIKISPQPKCILIGGLPGVGKSNLVNKLIKENQDREFVVIDSDVYRKLHPDYSRIVKNPETAVIETKEFANRAEYNLIKRAFRDRADIISVSTLKATETINNLLYEPAKMEGYEVEIHVMSAPIEECALSAQMRYEEQIRAGEFPRFVEIEYIKSSMKGIRDTIQFMQAKSEYPLIKIYNRGKGKNSEPVEVYSNFNPNKRFYGIMDAFLNPRKSITSEEAEKNIRELVNLKSNRNASINEFDVLMELESMYNLNKENGRF